MGIESKACPLLSIASAAAGGGHSLAGCLGEKCAFCKVDYYPQQHQVKSCAVLKIADSLQDLANR